MATKRITKAEKIGEAISSYGARSRIYGTEREKAWARTRAADAGEHCAHVAEYQHRTAQYWSKLQDHARFILVTLTGAVV